MTYRIATESGEIVCGSGARCPYKGGDYIVTLTSPLTGQTCESVLTPSMFAGACKELA